MLERWSAKYFGFLYEDPMRPSNVDLNYSLFISYYTRLQRLVGLTLIIRTPNGLILLTCVVQWRSQGPGNPGPTPPPVRKKTGKKERKKKIKKRIKKGRERKKDMKRGWESELGGSYLQCQNLCFRHLIKKQFEYGKL